MLHHIHEYVNVLVIKIDLIALFVFVQEQIKSWVYTVVLLQCVFCVF